MEPGRIYLDNQATTAVDPRVLQVMIPYFSQEYGNPHSDGHSFGWNASSSVERSRANVAALIGADAREIVFTSGATESCNIVLRGITKRNTGRRRRIVTAATEHPCVLETCLALGKEGYDMVVLPVQSDGLLDLQVVRDAVDDRTLLVTVMLANNEIGVLQSISEIADVCRQAGTYMHTDATQAVGKIPVDVRQLDIDFMSFSGHKYYGPKGIGGLYVRWGRAEALCPLTTGGGQEAGLRPGTVPVPLAVGFGEASLVASCDLKTDMERSARLAGMLYDMLRQSFPDIHLFGHPSRRLPGNLSIGFPGISAEEIVDRVGNHLAVSTGSACSSVTSKSSHVIEALQPDPQLVHTAIRISVGRFNTDEDITRSAKSSCRSHLKAGARFWTVQRRLACGLGIATGDSPRLEECLILKRLPRRLGSDSGRARRHGWLEHCEGPVESRAQRRKTRWRQRAPFPCVH